MQPVESTSNKRCDEPHYGYLYERAKFCRSRRAVYEEAHSFAAPRLTQLVMPHRMLETQTQRPGALFIHPQPIRQNLRYK